MKMGGTTNSILHIVCIKLIVWNEEYCTAADRADKKCLKLDCRAHIDEQSN